MNKENTAVLDSINPDAIESLFEGCESIIRPKNTERKNNRYTLAFDYHALDKDGNLMRDWSKVIEKLKYLGAVTFAMPQTAQRFGSENSELNAQRYVVEVALNLLQRKYKELGVI